MIKKIKKNLQFTKEILVRKLKKKKLKINWVPLNNVIVMVKKGPIIYKEKF